MRNYLIKALLLKKRPNGSLYNYAENYMENINRILKLTIAELQSFYLMIMQSVISIFKKPIYLKDLIEQMDYSGAQTIIIIILVALFIGMALSLQIAAEFSVLGMQMYTGRVVGISIISEIGPVAAALVFAGRAGSGMASELGTLVLRHQVDTLRVFGIDPIKKLLTPRIIGSILMLPALTIIADFVSLLGAYYIITVVNNQSSTVFWDSIRLILIPQYIISGTIKPFIFGLIISSISCFTGFTTHGGAVGLKSSTTRAFVLSTILIIVCDFVITKIILFTFGYQV
ncbi:MAG TPA: ABC transporter permease [Chitinispirillaceae bacterium]|nr:ABC transporter permease [Chitinispirillaceae bacterium]